MTIVEAYFAGIMTVLTPSFLVMAWALWIAPEARDDEL